MDSCVWIPGFGFQGLDSRVWIPGFGVLGLESWAWIPGLGFLGLESWVWSPGLGLDSWILTPGQHLKEDPVKTLSFLHKFANHEKVLMFEFYASGEGGPETHFKKGSLHKLARALHIALTW